MQRLACGDKSCRLTNRFAAKWRNWTTWKRIPQTTLQRYGFRLHNFQLKPILFYIFL